MDQKRPHQHGGHGVTGNAEGHQRDERTADTGIVRGFRTGEPLRNARAEIIRALRESLLLSIGHSHRNRRTCCGYRADDGAQRGATKNGFPQAPQAAKGGHQPAQVRCSHGGCTTAFDTAKHLRQAKEADRQRHELDPRLQRRRTEVETRHICDDVEAHHAAQQTDRAAQYAPEGGTGRRVGEHGKAEDRRHRELGTAELHGGASDERRHEHKDREPHDAADRRGEQRVGKRFTRSATAGHRVAFQLRNDSPWRAGYVDQDGGDRSTEYACREDGHEKHHRGDGAHCVSCGKQDRQCHRRAYAR